MSISRSFLYFEPLARRISITARSNPAVLCSNQILSFFNPVATSRPSRPVAARRSVYAEMTRSAI